MAKSSPFEAAYKQLGAGFGRFDGWRLASDFGNVDAEVRAFENGCAAFDLSSFGRIKITGPGASDIIDTVIAGTGDLPEENQWLWSVVEDKDRSLGYCIRLARSAKSFLIMTLPAEKDTVLELLRRPAAGNSNDGLEDITEKTAMLGFYGPGTVDSVRSVLPADINIPAPGRISTVWMLIISATVIRGSWTGSDGIEVICPLSIAPLAVSAVSRYQAKTGIVPAGALCLQRVMGKVKDTPAG